MQHVLKSSRTSRFRREPMQLTSTHALRNTLFARVELQHSPLHVDIPRRPAKPIQSIHIRSIHVQPEPSTGSATPWSFVDFTSYFTRDATQINIATDRNRATALMKDSDLYRRARFTQLRNLITKDDVGTSADLLNGRTSGCDKFRLFRGLISKSRVRETRRLRRKSCVKTYAPKTATLIACNKTREPRPANCV